MTLERRTPMRRAALPRGSGLARGGALPARRAAPRRAGDRLEHGAAWAEVLEVLHARAGWRCEGCGAQGVPLEGHHRRTRRFGPDCPANALLLCPTCHHGRAHGHPAEARAAGWVVSRHGTDSACEVPVVLHRHGWVTLGCDGTIGACNPTSES